MSEAVAIARAEAASVADADKIGRLLSGVDPRIAANNNTARSPEQEAAGMALLWALDEYIYQFGVAGAGLRLASTVDYLRYISKNALVTERIRAARAEINRQRHDLTAAGYLEEAEELVGEPTPPYPGKAKDDAWLARVVTLKCDDV